MNEAALKERLKIIAAEKESTLNKVWKQLLLERFLARLSNSEYQHNFIFKGGLLLAQYVDINREAIDIDFLMTKIKSEMKRVHFVSLLTIGNKCKIYLKSLADGTYSPRCLKRYYFSDEVVNQVHLSDLIFQHGLLKQLKSTFKHVMNPNIYHLAGPTGVKYATQRIKQVLEEDMPNYVLRVDIKSFYASIPHFKLIQDIKKYYHDPKLIAMLEGIITNPIDAPRGYKNPIRGIALRGPLSQFFSGIYLKLGNTTNLSSGLLSHVGK